MTVQVPLPDTAVQLPPFLTAAQALQNRLFMSRWIMASKATQPLLVIGTGDTAKVKLSNTVEWILGGVPQAQVTTAEVALSGTALAVSEKCKFLISINSAGALVATQGPIVAASGTALLPALPATSICLGDCEVETDASTTFTPGTTGLGASGITDTYRDLIAPDSGPTGLTILGSP